MPNRGTTLLVILQAWILPCSYGFTYTPLGLGSNSGEAGSACQAFTAPRPRPLKADAAASWGTPLSLSMVDGARESLDPSADEVGLCARPQVSRRWLQLYGHPSYVQHDACRPHTMHEVSKGGRGEKNEQRPDNSCVG